MAPVLQKISNNCPRSTTWRDKWQTTAARGIDCLKEVADSSRFYVAFRLSRIVVLQELVPLKPLAALNFKLHTEVMLYGEPIT